MAIKSVKIPVSQLQVGMFVADLDRPWVETPFPIQGFYIRHEQDIKALGLFCKHVYVDQALLPEARAVVHSNVNAGAESKRASQALVLPPIVVRNRQFYTSASTVRKELGTAQKLQSRLNNVLSDTFAQINAGHSSDVKAVSEVAGEMVDSVIRNADALMWLTRVQARSEYSYQHAVSASVLALVFGRHLGLERSLLKMLATGVLLSQVGKARLPKELLAKQGMLTPEEFAEYKRFIDYGVEILQQADSLPPQAIAAVEFHRERHNGSGFPKGVTGEKIPLLGKIAGIVDLYQELIEPHPGVPPLTSLEAVGRLFEVRNIEFQEDLVEQFIQAVGIYPTGTLVELSSREVGIVVEHNPERKLWPKVMVILDQDRAPLKQGRMVDLKACNEQGQAGEMVNITASLPFGAYDIDPSRLKIPGSLSRWSLRHLMG